VREERERENQSQRIKKHIERHQCISSFAREEEHDALFARTAAKSSSFSSSQKRNEVNFAFKAGSIDARCEQEEEEQHATREKKSSVKWFVFPEDDD
jgi:hypothetical protein